MHRRAFGALVAGAVASLPGSPGYATQATGFDPRQVEDNWYRLILELVRHTATYSPPVASRAFAYLGVTAYEAIASGHVDMVSLAGQLNGWTAAPAREPGDHDEAAVLQGAMSAAVAAFFGNTGPSGQQAIARMTEVLSGKVAAGLDPAIAARSLDYGRAVAAAVEAWSADDGGAVIENMGFPLTWTLSDKPGTWRPTSTLRQQQAPLLPEWGRNRPFALSDIGVCDIPPPPAFSTDPASAFYAEAKEVLDTTRALTPEQIAIARFWSDDPMLSVTPPGHWIAITRKTLSERNAPVTESAEILARLGIAVADAFIACWRVKYRDDLIRPVTYIRATMDKDFTPLLITPPFPEYPSGHSAQSGAASAVLTAFFGPDFAFTDDTYEADGQPARSFPNFAAAAAEAATSRLYGGMHYRSAIEQGLKLGACTGAHAVALRTRA